MEEIHYTSKYGHLTLLPISEFIPISTIYGENAPEDCFIALEQAEQVALITENDHIQCAFYRKDKQFKPYVVYCDTSHTGAICKVIDLEFYCNKTAEEEIQRLHDMQRLINYYG